MPIPENLRYTREHEWMRLETDGAVFGISHHAQQALGDIVFVELPEVGREIRAGEGFAVVESVKAVSDVYAPLNGIVSATNEQLESAPELINQDPYGNGWIAKVALADASDLGETMSADEYRQFLEV